MKILRRGPLRSRRRVPGALKEEVRADLEAIRKLGDRALGKGGARSAIQRIPPVELRRAFRRLPPRSRTALEAACRHLGAVARRELAALKQFDVHPTSGLSVFHRRVPLGRVGCLVPAWRISALLHVAIPAAVAGVPQRVLCTPPGPEGGVDDSMLAAAYMCDISEMYAIGGASAVGALAYGTPTIAPVERILGSGDAAVRLAKAEVAGTLAVDPADGPLELLVLADDTASVELVAADLIAQAELDADADCFLVTTSEAVAKGVVVEIRRRVRQMTPTDPARGPLARARAMVAGDLAEAVDLVNEYCPQRLSLQVVRPDDLVGTLRGFGALFVGLGTPPCLAELVGGAGGLAPAGGASWGQGALDLASLRPPMAAIQVDPSAYVRLSRLAATLADLEGRAHARRALDIRVFDPSRGA